MESWMWLLLVVVSIVLVAVVSVALGRRRQHESLSTQELTLDESARPLPAVVVNPTKFTNVDTVRATVTDACATYGWQEPLWLETTVEDPGFGQAREALDKGAELVCALGGDGTVRNVASALVGTEIPLGLLPAGTGNLLARNLDLPYASLDEALVVALTGGERVIDVGKAHIQLIPPPDADEDENGEHPDPRPVPRPQAVEETFLVMGGLGFDAMIMANAPEKLKAQIGPIAYIWSGIRHLRGPRFKASVALDDMYPRRVKARTILFANVGDLLAGIKLLPAKADDGHLDALAITPKSLSGWLRVAIHVLTRGRHGTRRVMHMRFQSMQLRLREPQEMQLDGDPIGSSRSVDVEVVPSSLRVRVTPTTD